MKKYRIGYQSGECVENNVMQYLEEHFEDYPDRIAMSWVRAGAVKQWSGNALDPLPHDNINYRDFTHRIRTFAAGLLKIGIQKGDRVILFLPMGVDMYTAMFAVQRIGAIAVFLDSWARAGHLGASAECVKPKAMISMNQAFQLISQVPEFKDMPIRIGWGPGDTFTHKFEEVLNTQGEAPIAAVASETTALITFTTGSSGKPKGADRTHRFLSAQHEALSKVIPYEAQDWDLPAFPIFSLNNLASGVSTVIPGLNLAAPSPQDPAILVSQLLSEKVTCTTLSPSMLVGVSKYASEKSIQLKGLRRVVTGGAPISKDDVRHFIKIAPNAIIWVLYGSTEVEPMAHIEEHEMIKEGPTQKDPEILEEGVNVGEISEDLDYKFIRIHKDPIDLNKTPWSQLELAAGEIGEFIVSGDHVCENYYNDAEAVRRAKIKEQNGKIWHRTGDLAYLDANKHLWMVGRIHNAISREGKYYFPVRPETLLKRMDFCIRAAFTGMPDPKKGEKTVACLQVKPGSDKAKIKAEVLRIFEKNKIPIDELRTMPEIPMDPRHHSKVEYNILHEMIQKGQGDLL